MNKKALQKILSLKSPITTVINTRCRIYKPQFDRVNSNT